jgi:hypothetical protein
MQVLLTVGPQRLRLKLDGATQSFEVPFDAGAFDPRRLASDVRPNAMRAQGEALWSAAFSESLGVLLNQAAEQAADRGVSLTLRIVPAPDLSPHLRWLGWETAYEPRRDFLALKKNWSLVRGVDPFDRFREAPTGGIGVLVLTLRRSAEADDEVEDIRAAAAGAGPVEVRGVLDEAALISVLESQDAPIVHVIGQGRGESLLLPDGDLVSARKIAAAIAGNRAIRVVVLSAAWSELVADAIAQKAHATVLGHRNLVRDEHARAVTARFYRHFLDGVPADVALTETRRALDRLFPGERAWTSAILLTGWPPLALVPRDDAARRPVEPADRVTANDLVTLLHATNRDRINQLLDIADWDPLRRQLDEAGRTLAARSAEKAP